MFETLRISLQALANSGDIPGIFQYGFVINALLCAIFLGPILGGVGTMVVTKRMAFFSQAIGNAALTGVALGVMLGESYTSPYATLFGFCLLFGIVLNYTRGKTGMSADTLIGVFLSISLALGACLLLFVSAKVNTHVLESVLFGSILTVNDLDITVLLVVSLLCLIVGLPLYNQMLMGSLNASLAHVRGVKVNMLEYVFIIMITVLTVASVKIVGAVLVEALLLIPAAAARNISKSLGGFFAWSVLFATASCLAGIVIPMQWDIPVPSGGAIILVAAVFFVLTTVLRSCMPAFKEAKV